MGVQKFRKPSELQKAVANRLPSARPVIIALDGMENAGKSTLASSLAEVFDGQHVKVDDFLNEHKGGYVEHIRYDKLDQELESVGHGSGLAVVEGICILDVLARIDVEPDISIYVKRISNNFWRDGYDLGSNKTADEIIADRRREIQKLFGLSEDERGFAYEEIIRYHCRRPHESSDLIFERTEDA